MMNSARIEQLKKYLKETPEDPFLHYALALEYQKEQPTEAAKTFEYLLAEYADYLPAYYHAAHCFWEMNEIEKARDAFERGIRLATLKKEHNTARELQNAYQNFQFEVE